MRELDFIISNSRIGKSLKTDPIRDLHGVLNGSEHQTVGCQPGSKLRDTEQIPFVGEGGLEGFLRRNVLRFAVDAWCVPKGVEIGYEISFDRHLFEPQPMRTLDDTWADIVLGRETDRRTTCNLVRRAPAAADRPQARQAPRVCRHLGNRRVRVQGVLRIVSLADRADCPSRDYARSVGSGLAGT